MQKINHKLIIANNRPSIKQGSPFPATIMILEKISARPGGWTSAVNQRLVRERSAHRV